MKIEEILTYEELVASELMSPEYLPNPEISRCLVARNEEGRIVGFSFVQPIICIEPTWVEPEKRGSRLALRLFDRAVDCLAEGTAKDFICHADTPEAAEYLQRIGMEETTQRVFKLDLRKWMGGETKWDGLDQQSA